VSASLAEVERVSVRRRRTSGSGETPQGTKPEPLNTKYENNARAKSTGDRVIELLPSEAAQAAESRDNALNMRV